MIYQEWTPVRTKYSVRDTRIISVSEVNLESFLNGLDGMVKALGNLLCWWRKSVLASMVPRSGEDDLASNEVFPSVKNQGIKPEGESPNTTCLAPAQKKTNPRTQTWSRGCQSLGGKMKDGNGDGKLQQGFVDLKI
jgi:hypothetical protein